ncbi:HAMP domain-containing histidine kinase [Sporosarcina sp. E16_3]|uniref:sensor histidine kinase n=1 Tax=Sporosarcina sp. E16_3 TaxID=2789293 RepID=UPI001A92189B|nr:HAMP domain-containing sensor histidine kinase [Sporosarcina sp. E16_3]MBO0601537.1 HAMP domain-containing histidine kinase [Sporosarcina sp. E16_3]
MKSNKSPLLLWVLLVSLFLIALNSTVQADLQNIGKSYVNSEVFKANMDTFYQNIGPTTLNPINMEEAEKTIPVAKSEIEAHRNRFGTMSEQISNIQDQYVDRIADAKESKNEELKAVLIKERDTKLDDIRQNFESDEHVEAKIRTKKAAMLKGYLNENLRLEIDEFPVFYELVDTKTGEKFSYGDMFSHAAYKKVFDGGNGYLKASSIPVDRDLTFMRDDEIELTRDDMLSISNPTRTFEGKVIVSKDALKDGLLSHQIKQYNQDRYFTFVLWLVGAIALAVVFTKLQFKKGWVTENDWAIKYSHLKIDMKVGLLGVSTIAMYAVLNIVSNRFRYFYFINVSAWVMNIIQFGFLLLFLLAVVFQLVNFIERLRIKGMLEKDIADSYTVSFFKAFHDMFLKKSIGVQTFILLIGFFLAGIGFVVVFLMPVSLILYIPAVLFLGLPALYMLVKRSAYLNRIIVATEAMAAGRLHEEIKVEGKSPLAEHANNLNNLREGVHVSMTEQAKSERLKTELITNVSHDLRTPLTSIITYTDLLKKEDITAEERTKYVDILDKKSQRLKTLIEDLFEVSKMASGNLELNKQRVDMTQLLQQALAEHEEEISKSGLDFRVNFPESALVAYVDGKRWWRVLDNLIVNAIKYTLPGTRVYITLRKVGDTAEFIVKNVTKYELGENTDELFERFKRADTSRHTDGSGLGLAIAQSIVDLHNGNMKIEVDGDLFKVTVVVAVV